MITTLIKCTYFSNTKSQKVENVFKGDLNWLFLQRSIKQDTFF